MELLCFFKRTITCFFSKENKKIGLKTTKKAGRLFLFNVFFPNPDYLLIRFVIFP